MCDTGDSTPDDEMNVLLEMADEDSSGELNFEQFVMLLKATNPTEGAEESVPEKESDSNGLFNLSLW